MQAYLNGHYLLRFGLDDTLLLTSTLLSEMSRAMIEEPRSGPRAFALPIDGLLLDGVRVRERDGVYVHTEWQPVGVTEQFIEDAEVYFERYFARLDFRDLVSRCLAVAGLDASGAIDVLDIGSGGGSSVFALCELMPDAHVVASDISPPLLRMLAELAASRPELQGRIAACCFDIHQPFFRPDSFDLVLGTAVLHHLLDPAAALRHVAAALRPGGQLVLVEPLEAGSLLLTVLFERVLVTLARIGQDDGPIAHLMRAMRLDIHSRLGVPVPKPWTATLDDKWVFDEPYLHSLGADLGMTSVDIHASQEGLERVFEEAFNSLLSDSGMAGVDVPPAVDEVLREFDRGLSAEVKAHAFPSGIIVFQKPSRDRTGVHLNRVDGTGSAVARRGLRGILRQVR